MITYYSNCCGAEIKHPDSTEMDICPDCHDWCEPIPEDDEEEIELKPEAHERLVFY